MFGCQYSASTRKVYIDSEERKDKERTVRTGIQKSRIGKAWKKVRERSESCIVNIVIVIDRLLGSPNERMGAIFANRYIWSMPSAHRPQPMHSRHAAEVEG